MDVKKVSKEIAKYITEAHPKVVEELQRAYEEHERAAQRYDEVSGEYRVTVGGGHDARASRQPVAEAAENLTRSVEELRTVFSTYTEKVFNEVVEELRAQELNNYVEKPEVPKADDIDPKNAPIDELSRVDSRSTTKSTGVQI